MIEGTAASLFAGGRQIGRGHACRKSKADRCDLTHVSLSFLNVALTKSSESRSLRLQHHAEVKRWSCSFRPWCRRAHRRAREGRQAPSFETVRLSTDAFRARSSSEAKMPAEHCGKTELPFDLAQDQHAAIRRQLSTIKRGSDRFSADR